jgi:ectoine hydroxylase-related dioxygenase (phytanoyl-CoA dioxygenase family)
VLFHALGAWRVRPAFHDLLWSPALLMASYQLLGTGFRLFHDQVFAKPAHHGGVVAWHQDYSYWTWTRPMAHLTSWMALDDVDRENGCLHYVPGSHRWGLVERTDLGGEMDAIRGRLSPAQLAALDGAVAVEMKRGEASFHHPLLMHGSHANRSNRPRRATLVNVFADGVRSNMWEEDRPGTAGYPHVPRGERMGGTYYPLLLDPAERLGEFLASIPTVGAGVSRP